jgi:hypothetical protein
MSIRADRRRIAWSVAATLMVVSAGVLAADLIADESGGSTSPPGTPSTSAVVEASDRAFQADSWWNTALPADTPLDPAGALILDYLRTGPESGRGCLTLAGAGHSHWGQPVYEARPSDPQYDVEGLSEPLPELERLRIPEGAQSGRNTDNNMTIYDRGRGYVVALSGAQYDPDRDVWSADGATVTYLDSNGLHVDTGRSDDPRNRGSHRGNNGATMAVELDDVLAGTIGHVLKASSGPEVADRYVFPMVGSDGDYQGSDLGVPPQGLRLRIKPSIDLDEQDLDPEALVIARALQDYGFYIGDSGGTTALKLQNTWAEGRGQLWKVSADDLCGMPFTTDYWDVVAEGYDPTRSGRGR